MMNLLARRLQGRLHYAWVVSAVVVLVLLVSAGLRAAPGILIIPLEQNFGWTRSMVSGALSVGLLMFGVIGPFAAAMMQRFGVRPLVFGALLFMAAGTGGSYFMREPWHLTATWGVMVGTAAGVMTMVLGAVVANRWFTARRGMVIGLFMACTAAGQLIFLPAMAWVAQQWGWHAVAGICTLAALAVVPVVLLFLPERPAQLGLLPYGATQEEPAPLRVGNPIVATFRSLRRAAPTLDFWLLGGTFMVCGFTTNGLIGTHLVPMCFEAGVPQVMAAGLLATMGVFNILGTTAAGWMSDKFDNRWLLFGYYTLRGASLIYLPYSGFTVYGLTVFSIFYGLDWLATAPATLRLLSDRFGRDEAPILFGWIFLMHQIGSAGAAWGAGFMRVLYGGYTEAFVTAGVIAFVGAGLSLMIGRSAKGPGLRPAIA